MNKKLPLVSVIAICYNHSRFVIETLNSIKNQTYKNTELFIMDDCSDDDSAQVINNWIEEGRVDCMFIEHKENQGVCKTLNEALSFCNGEYIQMIACDDVMFQNKTQLQVEILEKDDKFQMVCSNFSTIDEYNQTIQQAYFDEDFLFPQDVFDSLLTRKGILIHPGTSLVRANVFNEIGNYNEEVIQEDFDMLLRISSHYKIFYTNEVLIRYRILKNSLSRDEKYQETIFMDLIKVISLYTENDNIKITEASNFALFKVIHSLILFKLKLNQLEDIEELMIIQNRAYFLAQKKECLTPYLEYQYMELYSRGLDKLSKITKHDMFKNVKCSKKILINYFNFHVFRRVYNVLRK